jgi:protein-tyrosine phosphatase
VGLRAFAEYGVETVVDLRWAEEIALNPSPITPQVPNIRYLHISLLSSTATQWRELAQNCEKEMWKCVVLERVRSELREVLQTIAAAPPGPLLFHCVAGKDRTGIIAALLLALADVEPSWIAHDYAASTEMLSNAYLKRYADMDPSDILENVRCPEEGVRNMLDYLERQGGVGAYLRAVGLSEEEIARLRARLRD